MSTTLWWKPLVQPGIGIGHPLKGMIARRYFDQDGSLGSDSIIFTKNDIPFLRECIADLEKNVRPQTEPGASFNWRAIEDAERLISAINEYGDIEAWLQG